jgi:OOP family OmpA-OmpF porin
MNTQYVTDNFTFLSLGMAYKIGRQINESEWASPIDGLRDDVTTLFVKIDGFTDDADNDGVSDAFDKSPNTPLGVAVDGSGNALDVDMDNVPDYRDADPFSNRGVLVDVNGVELDDDKDGVPNSKDLESNTLVGTMVNQFGMNVSSTVYTNGGGMIYFPSIYFNSGSAIVGSSNENRIAIIALMLKNNADISLNVIGHTDNVGNTKFNKELGLKRAKAVINYLVSNYNIDAKRLNAITKGEEDPLSNVTTINNGIEGSSAVNTLTEINRRVDFEITD